MNIFVKMRHFRKPSLGRKGADDPTLFPATGRPRREDYPLPNAPRFYNTPRISIDDLDLLSILSVTWKYKFFVAFVFLLTLAGSFEVYRLVTPVYEASTVLLVGRSSIDDPIQDSAKMQLTVRSQAQIADSIEVVKSALLDVGLSNVPVAQPSALRRLSAKIGALVSETDKTDKLPNSVPDFDRSEEHTSNSSHRH